MPDPRPLPNYLNVEIAKEKAAVERVPTGIPGMDDLIGGGFERGSTILITGDAGSGKTTFALQFLYNGAMKYSEPALFISFEETKQSIFKHSQSYSWDFEELEKRNMFQFLNFHPHEVEKLVEEGGGQIYDAIQSMGVKRLAFDSLTSYSLLFQTPYQVRESELALFDMLHKWGTTSLLISESEITLDNRPSGGAEFLTDAVIILYHSRQDSVRVRAIEVLKARGVKHIEKICPIEFVEGSGVRVYPNETVFSSI